MALDLDMAAEVCLTMNGQPPVATLLMAILEGFASSGSSGGSSGSSSGYMPPFENVGGGHNPYDGSPVYVDGHFRGEGLNIPMSQEEFISRTTTPPSKMGYGFETRGTPRIINYNSPDVV